MSEGLFLCKHCETFYHTIEEVKDCQQKHMKEALK